MDSLDFAAAQAQLPAAIALKGTADDDAYVHATLPALLAARAPAAFLTQPELSRVMRWKLRSGKSRPNLQKYVDELADADVRSCSAAAFAALPPGGGGAGLKAALGALCKLKGVGPATATAVLAAHAPRRCAFMSDEALLAVLGTKAYTAGEAVELAQRCSERAAALGGAWSAQGVQRAVWASEVVRKHGGGAGGGGGGGGAGGAALSGKKRQR
jgi:hypothetical protein